MVAESVFDIEYKRLLSALDQATELLRRFGETGWGEWLGADRVRIAGGDLHGLDHLLSAFGGMGSFDDLLIHPLNGHSISEEELSVVNEQLSDYRATIWAAGRAMRRELDRR